MIKDLVIKNRSYRRFYEDFSISKDILTELIDLARLSASGRNAQPLKYIISNSEKTNTKIFPTLSWAGYLTDWDGPSTGERPSAYIIMLCDTKIATQYFCDHGIAAQSILLGAVEKELGGCIIGNVKKSDLQSALNIPKQYEIIQVLALGKPKETVVLEEVDKSGDIKYWRDDQLLHHVPKRALNDIILNFES